jgi:hypothetical protein
MATLLPRLQKLSIAGAHRGGFPLGDVLAMLDAPALTSLDMAIADDSLWNGIDIFAIYPNLRRIRLQATYEWQVADLSHFAALCRAHSCAFELDLSLVARLAARDPALLVGHGVQHVTSTCLSRIDERGPLARPSIDFTSLTELRIDPAFGAEKYWDRTRGWAIRVSMSWLYSLNYLQYNRFPALRTLEIQNPALPGRDTMDLALVLAAGDFPCLQTVKVHLLMPDEALSVQKVVGVPNVSDLYHQHSFS